VKSSREVVKSSREVVTPSDVLVQTVSQDTGIGGQEGSRIYTGIDYASNLAEYSKYRYLRIYDGTAAGQVAHITQDATNSGYGNGYLLVDQVWNTISNTLGGFGVTSANFFTTKPRTADKFVLVEDTQLHGDEVLVPALTTTHELLDDIAFEPDNTNFAKQIDAAKIQLQKWAGRPLTFVSVPVLYYHYRNGPKATAFTPNLANVQVVGGQFYFPKQFGPLKDGSDLFENDVAQRVAGSVFIDSWTLYHLNEGEVHCGSATKRAIPAFQWWKQLKP
jgi:hypothetical protein